jgi:large-conductance mechanosensitive channel
MKYIINFLIITISILFIGCSKPVPNCNEQTNKAAYYDRANNAYQKAIKNLDKDTKNIKTSKGL